MFYVDNFEKQEYQAIKFLKHDTNAPAYVDEFYLIDDCHHNSKIKDIEDPFTCELCNLFTQHISTLKNLGINTGDNFKCFHFSPSIKDLKSAIITALLFNLSNIKASDFFTDELEKFKKNITEKDENKQLTEYIFKKDVKQFDHIFKDIIEKYKPYRFTLLKHIDKIFNHLGDWEN